MKSGPPKRWVRSRRGPAASAARRHSAPRRRPGVDQSDGPSLEVSGLESPLGLGT